MKDPLYVNMYVFHQLGSIFSSKYQRHVERADCLYKTPPPIRSVLLQFALFYILPTYFSAGSVIKFLDSVGHRSF